jgi:hypothetical protein
LNKTLNKFIAIMGNQEATRNVTPPPPVSTPLVITPLQVSQPSRVKMGIPSHFDGDRVQGHAFLTSCELYILLTAADFVDEQVCIHWALSYFKGGHAASFAEHILWQELRSGTMCFASWSDFTEEFTSMFCPENKVTTALMQLESDRYCKETSVHFLTSPILSHSPPVHMYSHSSPLYHLQGPYLKPTTSRPGGPTAFQKLTHR